MGHYEYLYLASTAPIAEEADWFIRVLGFELIPVQGGDPEEIGLRGPAATVDGLVGLALCRNHSAAPDETEAIEAYGVEIEFWYRRRDSDDQRREARHLFDRLIAARPSTPMLLTLGSCGLGASWLPPAGLHEFPPDTTIFAGHFDRWRPWVLR
ncbi:hypothetical protein [Amycolatopsis sp. 195334CR]|uniref:hypothetical protein n=1 Tax=Amycolatopsis sp. 195334CR TaxID=2814588 RepID=UPI001A8FADE0|nr:hypothetical protein [Amycolatopsis sp. 195334CR]MBN6039544.1 hypothetical protein [Amycolatopsis sp. 195334CR]